MFWCLACVLAANRSLSVMVAQLGSHAIPCGDVLLPFVSFQAVTGHYPDAKFLVSFFTVVQKVGFTPVPRPVASLYCCIEGGIHTGRPSSGNFVLLYRRWDSHRSPIYWHLCTVVQKKPVNTFVYITLLGEFTVHNVTLSVYIYAGKLVFIGFTWLYDLKSGYRQIFHA